jgi:polysaccharide deacetylase 2 family uncharacterized protein YibQ
MKKIAFTFLLGIACFFSGISSVLAASDGGKVMIGLIVDDLGNQRKSGLEAVNLPGPLAYSILPHTPYGEMLAERAHAQDKEVMLHLPMQSMHDNPMGKGGLRLNMTRRAFKRAVKEDIDSIPHVIGVNNHMGSLLTQQSKQMSWLMSELKERGGLFFIDSRTTERTVARLIAQQFSIETDNRDVFLDHEQNPEAIRFQFQRLLSIAKRNGGAIGIGHPYPETLRILREQLTDAESKGFNLVPVRKIMGEKRIEQRVSFQN